MDAEARLRWLVEEVPVHPLYEARYKETARWAVLEINQLKDEIGSLQRQVNTLKEGKE